MWGAGNTSITGDGGFMSEANDMTASASKPKAQRLQSVVPVCVRQIRDHPEDEFKLFGMQTQILSLVAILREYEVQSTKVTYKIEDHTGTISAIWWLESDGSSAPNLPLVKEGRYLRVYGSMRIHENERLLMVLRMFPVDNINEITTHLLEVIHTRLEAEKVSKGDGDVSGIKMNNPGLELANSMTFINEDQSMNSTGFNALQQKVYDIVKAHKSTVGISTSNVLSQFPANQHRTIRDTLEFLVSEGHAYSTVDNDHFKVTESM